MRTPHEQVSGLNPRMPKTGVNSVRSPQSEPALLTAVTSAAVALVIALALRAVGIPSWDAGLYIILAVLVFPQAITAAGVAARTSARPFLRGLAAGVVTGALIGIGFELPRVSAGAGGVLQTTGAVIGIGTILSALAAWIGAKGSRWERSARPEQGVLRRAAWIAIATIALLVAAPTSFSLILGIEDAILAPPQPRFVGELAVQSTADQFVAFTSAQNHHTVSLNITCQYGAHVNPNICRSGVASGGTVILFVTSKSQLDAFAISQNTAAGAEVVAGAQTHGSLLLKGSFMVVNGTNNGGSASVLAGLGVSQFVLLESVGSGS